MNFKFLSWIQESLTIQIKSIPKNLLMNVYEVKWSEVAQSCPTLYDPVDCTYQAPPSMGFSRQEFWSGLPFPSPGDLPNPGIEPRSPALWVDSLLSELPFSPRLFFLPFISSLFFWTTLSILVSTVKIWTRRRPPFSARNKLILILQRVRRR